MALLFNDSAIDQFPRGDVVSFSGADIRALIQRPNYRSNSSENPANAQTVTHDLGAIQTLSVSTFRAKSEVRSLGFQNVMGYARGSRTIGGHLVFALLEKHPFNDTGSSPSFRDNAGILDNSSGYLRLDDIDLENADSDFQDEYFFEVYQKHQYDFTWDAQKWGETMFVDELPPFNIIVTFANEAGNVGALELYGVEIQEEGMTLSIEDLFTEMTYSYVARGAKLFKDGKFQGRISAGVSAVADDFALQQLGPWVGGLGGLAAGGIADGSIISISEWQDTFAHLY